MLSIAYVFFNQERGNDIRVHLPVSDLFTFNYFPLFQLQKRRILFYWICLFDYCFTIVNCFFIQGSASGIYRKRIFSILKFTKYRFFGNSLFSPTHSNVSFTSLTSLLYLFYSKTNIKR
jgi:hypothetical protein